MADEKYIVPEKPVYAPEIRAIQDTDPVKASTIVNPVLSQMIENMHATYLAAEKAGDIAGQAIAVSEKGKPQGVAELDADGKVPTAQLPDMNYDAGGSAAVVQTALDEHTLDRENPHKVSKAQVGLGNADNTSDADKPVSTAVQAALNQKANLASPVLTGVPTAPTAAVGTNTAQIATTAFVQENAGSDYPFVYQCTGTADSTAIADIVNDFFENGTAMTMKLIITGTMGIEFTDTYAMYINGVNERGAVCYLDFSDCNIPEITTEMRSFLVVRGKTPQIHVTGMVVTTTRFGIQLASQSRNNRFSNCNITIDGTINDTGSNTSNINCGVSIDRGSNNSFTNCVINCTGSSTGIGNAAGNSCGVNSTYGYNNSFINCTITGTGTNTCTGYGVYAMYGSINNFINCTITGAVNNTGTGKSYGVYCAGGNNFINCAIDSTGANGSSDVYGMYVHNDGCKINNCTINSTGAEGNGTVCGIYVTSNDCKISNCAINGTSVDGSSIVYGVYVFNGDCKISNCTIDSTGVDGSGTAYGLYMKNGECKINNCTIVGSGHYCIYTTSKGSNSFNGCTIIGSKYGLYADAKTTSTRITLIDCEIYVAHPDDEAIYQSSAASTISWYVVGCSFSTVNTRINGATQTAATATANAYLYMPAYANKFSQTIT